MSDLPLIVLFCLVFGTVCVLAVVPIAAVAHVVWILALAGWRVV